MGRIRQLRAGEPVPKGKPRRYKSPHGYMRLRWPAGNGDRVEAYEHRVAGGRITDARVVDHRDENGRNNDPKNLRRSDHRDNARQFYARNRNMTRKRAAQLALNRQMRRK